MNYNNNEIVTSSIKTLFIDNIIIFSIFSYYFLTLNHSYYFLTLNHSNY